MTKPFREQEAKEQEAKEQEALRNTSPELEASYAQQKDEERISKDLFNKATTSQYRMESERYIFNSIIGRGGMGVVLKGYDKLLSRDVAVKFLNSEFSDNDEARKIFLSEARLMAKLSHPNLIAVHDVCSVENRAMMVVELIEGEDLSETLKTTPTGLELDLVLSLGVQLAEVVQYLHDEGMVHRDLKPANVMLKPDKSIKLIDFGLTRTMEMLIIRTTSMRGTPAYMSPEQLKGELITSATDIYQIGATLFELFSGKLPFETNAYSPEARQKPPRLRDLLPEIDSEICEVITSCLAYKPGDRPKSAQIIADRFRAIQGRLALPDTSLQEKPSAPDTSWSPMKKLGLVALIVAMLAIVGVVLMNFSQTSLPDGSLSAAITTLPNETPTLPENKNALTPKVDVTTPQPEAPASLRTQLKPEHNVISNISPALIAPSLPKAQPVSEKKKKPFVRATRKRKKKVTSKPKPAPTIAIQAEASAAPVRAEPMPKNTPSLFNGGNDTSVKLKKSNDSPLLYKD